MPLKECSRLKAETELYVRNWLMPIF